MLNPLEFGDIVENCYSSIMKNFMTKEITTLNINDLERLKIMDLGMEVSTKLTACGGAEGTVVAGVVRSIRDSKVQGAK